MEEGQLPHVYPPLDDPTLCLFDPVAGEWDASMQISQTIVLWALDWIACYELWLMTGKWTGGGRHQRAISHFGFGACPMNYIPPRRSDGTIQHTRHKQPWPAGKLFRILSIDGGGIRGVFPAAYLSSAKKQFLGGETIAIIFIGRRDIHWWYHCVGSCTQYVGTTSLGNLR